MKKCPRCGRDKYPIGRKAGKIIWKHHPLDDYPEADLHLKVGGKIYRGTTDKQIEKERLLNYKDPKFPDRRMYFSEEPLDAAGYATIHAEDYPDSVPLLIESTIDQHLLENLSPGYEGLWEWYLNATDLHRKYVDKVYLVEEGPPSSQYPGGFRLTEVELKNGKIHKRRKT